MNYPLSITRNKISRNSTGGEDNYNEQAVSIDIPSR